MQCSCKIGTSHQVFLLEIKAFSTLLQEHFQLLSVGVLFALIVSWIAWENGFFKRPQQTAAERSFIPFGQVLGAFAIFLVITLFVIPLLAYLWFSIQAGHLIEMERLSLPLAIQGWWNAATIVLSALGLQVYCLLVGSHTQKAVWGIATTSPVRNFLFGSAAWFVSYPFVIIISQLVALGTILFLHREPVHHDQVAVKYLKETMSSPYLLIVTVLLIILIVPILEEILFRGFLQSWLKQVLSLPYAIAATSLIFSLFHFSTSQGWDNVDLILSLFVLSCFLGFLRERQKSLWASIGLHATFNAITVFALLLDEAGSY